MKSDCSFYQNKWDILVVGAGAAGLAAAIKAHDLGANVLIVDRDDFPGGILRQCIHSGFGIDYYKNELTGPEYLHKLLAAVKKRAIQIELNANVLSVGNGKKAILLSKKNGLHEIAVKTTILATGSYERTRENLMIAGGRPAGVFTAGQAQQLINLYGLKIGSRVVVQGTGDIGLIMIRRLLFEGYDVVSVFERLPSVVGLRRNRAQCLNDFGIIPQFKRQIIKIHGNSRVTGVTTIQVEDENPNIEKKGSEKFTPCDTVVLSAGLIPNRELVNDINTNSITGIMRIHDTSIFVCGNSLEIHDLADGASIQGETVAKNAVNLIAHAQEDNDEGIYKIGNYCSRSVVKDQEMDPFSGKDVICIICPRGCVLQENDYGCWRGEKFFNQEKKEKLRTLTTTKWVKLESGHQRVAIKSKYLKALNKYNEFLSEAKVSDNCKNEYYEEKIGSEVFLI